MTRESRRVVIGAAGAAVLMSLMGAQGGCAATSSGAGARSSSPAPADDNGGSSVLATAAPVSTPYQVPAQQEPRTLLKVRGNGIHQTRSFTAAGDWDLGWAYNCSSFGYRGNFQIDVASPGDGYSSNVGPNALGMKGRGVEHEHDGGTFYLTINSECDWSVIVVG